MYLNASLFITEVEISAHYIETILNNSLNITSVLNRGVTKIYKHMCFSKIPVPGGGGGGGGHTGDILVFWQILVSNHFEKGSLHAEKIFKPL